MHARDYVAGASQLQQQPDAAVVEAATTILAMLADSTRLRLMVELVQGERDVTALTAAVGAARPAVSQHLGKLRLAGLVRGRRDGRRQVYALTDEHVARLVTEAVRTAEHRVSDRPAHHLPAVAGAPAQRGFTRPENA